MTKKTKTVRLPIVLTPAQEKIDACPSRFIIVLAGRRFGKSTYAAYWLLRHCNKPGNYWYVGKTFNQVKEIVWHQFLAFIPRELIKSTNATDLTIQLHNGANIYLKGSDQEHNLRGRKIDAVVMEEAAFQKGSIWTEILRPSLADTMGPALFISTPKGINWFTKLYEYAKSGNDKDWATFYFTIHDNPLISKEEIAKIEATTDSISWRQEYMAEVSASVGLVYPEFSDSNIFHPTEMFEGHEQYECVRGIDWGLNDDTACVWLHIHPKTGWLIASQEWVQNGWTVARHAGVIKQRSLGLKVVPGGNVLDKTAFRLEGTSQTSVGRIFAQEGLPCVASQGKLEPTIDTTKRFIQGKEGIPWVYISQKCSKLIEAIRSFEHDQHEPDVLAAFRYAINHAVRTGKTPLASSIDFGTEDIESSLPSGTYIAASMRRRQGQYKNNFQWNAEYGVPE